MRPAPGRTNYLSGKIQFISLSLCVLPRIVNGNAKQSSNNKFAYEFFMNLG